MPRAERRAIATRIADHLPKSHLVCRWGGEEFIVVAYGRDREQARALGETLRADIEHAAIETLEDGSPVTVSVGITIWRDHDTVDGLLLRVDQALYQAKRDGRNRVRVAAAVPPMPVPVAE